jgi:hypothetical protein
MYRTRPQAYPRGGGGACFFSCSFFQFLFFLFFIFPAIKQAPGILISNIFEGTGYICPGTAARRPCFKKESWK